MFLRRGLLPRTEVKNSSTQEVATFGSLQDLAELELWVMSSLVPRCKPCVSWGAAGAGSGRAPGAAGVSWASVEQRL